MILRMLDECISALSCEWRETGGRPPPLPPVLCHMDLQPQNLAFKRDCDHNCFVASVMDWEEACYADPRFELLLICRRVLANREQAETLWQSYSMFVQQLSSSLSLRSKSRIHWTVGSIEPWLKLESVHSLCTLSLQAMVRGRTCSGRARQRCSSGTSPRTIRRPGRPPSRPWSPPPSPTW